MEAFLISGVPGAGKTTTSRVLAGRFERGVHIEGDVLSFDFVVTGLPAPHGENADPAGWHRHMIMRRQHMCHLADSFGESGFTPVLDDVVTGRAELDLHLQLLRTRPFHFVVLAPHIEVAAARDAARDKQVFEEWRHLDAELRANLAGVGLWLDTSELTVDEVVDQVLGRRAEALLA